MSCLLYTGGRAVYSEGRLIPHNFPITDLQQINATSGNGVISCSVSSGTANFNSSDATLDMGGVTPVANGAALLVNTTNIDNFENRELYCDDSDTNYFYLYPTGADNSEFISTLYGIYTVFTVSCTHKTIELQKAAIDQSMPRQEQITLHVGPGVYPRGVLVTTEAKSTIM